MKSRKTNLLADLVEPTGFAGMLLFVILAEHWEVVFGLKSFFYRDFGLFGYPLAYHHREMFWAGELPLWNPLNNCGIPFLAQWNTLTLYPLSLIYLLGPLPWSLNFFCLLHQALAGVGMYFLCHRLSQNKFAAAAAGLVFATNGLTRAALMWPNNIAALGWMPWVVWSMLRSGHSSRHKICAVLIAAVQLLTGAPEIIGFTWVAALGLTFVQLENFRERFLRVTGSGLLILAGALLLAAAQILPFLDLALHSHRGAGFGTDAWAMPSWGLGNFFVPLYRCYESAYRVFLQPDQSWTSSYYLGIFTVATLLAGLLFRRDRVFWFLIALGSLGLILAAGSKGHLYGWIKSFFPPLGMIRFPIKFVALTIFSFTLAFGLALGRWEESKAELRRWFLIGGGLALGLIAILAIESALIPFPDESVLETLFSAGSRAALLLLGGAVLLFGEKLSRQLAGMQAAFLLLLWFDLQSHMPSQNPLAAPWVYEEEPVASFDLERPALGGPRAMLRAEARKFLHQSALPRPESQYLRNRMGLMDNCNLVEKAAKLDGFFSLYLPEILMVQVILESHFANLNPENMIDTGDLFYLVGRPSGLADFASISHVTLRGKLYAWAARTNYLPVIFGGQRPVFLPRGQIYEQLADPNFDPREIVFFDAERQNGTATAGASTQRQEVAITNILFKPNLVECRVKSPAPAWITINQTYHHWWKAYVDGRPAPLLRANGAFQAVHLPAGESQLTLKYEDKSFFYGAIISALTAAILFFLFWREPKRLLVIESPSQTV